MGAQQEFGEIPSQPFHPGFRPWPVGLGEAAHLLLVSSRCNRVVGYPSPAWQLIILPPRARTGAHRRKPRSSTRVGSQELPKSFIQRAAPRAGAAGVAIGGSPVGLPLLESFLHVVPALPRVLAGLGGRFGQGVHHGQDACGPGAARQGRSLGGPRGAPSPRLPRACIASRAYLRPRSRGSGSRPSAARGAAGAGAEGDADPGPGAGWAQGGPARGARTCGTVKPVRSHT